MSWPSIVKVAMANESLLVKAFLPFVRTPTNLLKFAAERSPAAPLLKEWKADFKAGGARRDVAISRLLLGTGFGIAIHEAAQNGQITGSAPSDPKKARLLYADGWQPYSIKIGDTYYSYKRLDPLSTTLGVAADFATLPDGMSERQREDKATLLVASIMGNLASKTWLSGVSDLVSALDEPSRYADNVLQRLVSSLVVPAGVAQVARTMDPTRRKVETIGDAIQARVPGMSDNLMPQRDIWGQPIVGQGGVGPDILSPVWLNQQLNDPVNQELLKTDYAPGHPKREVGGRELSPQEYDRYAEMAGKRSHEQLTQLVTSPEWHALDNEEKGKAAKKVVDTVRDDVRAELFGVSRKKKSASLSDAPRLGDPIEGAPLKVPPPPPGFVMEGEAGGVNIYQDIQRAIPGIRITSGYRDEAYQADMRRRGYNPAQNSGHLSGSSLDLLPPPGKSMSWLREEVRKFNPDAQMLDEGDHLHTTFPGYYGAPPIGGAKGAGLRNPLQGMPPPPPGFVLD